MKYQDVINYLEEEIKTGALSSGSKLPSMRMLAHELNCSKSTVSKAYDELVSSKLAYVIDKTGYYLMKDPHDRLISDRIDLSPVYASTALEKGDIQSFMNRSLNQYHMKDIDVEGYYPLRETLKKYFKDRKIFSSIHDIIMMPSISQAILSILSLKTFNKVLVEDPIETDLIQLFKRKQGIELLSRDSLDLGLLELRIIKEKIQLLIITPHVHMPTTKSLDLEEKLQLLHICQQHNVHIVEINQYEDTLPYVESQSLYALDKCEIVFHLKTFKRVYSHMINDVVIVSPKAFSNHIKFYKETYIGQVSSLNQLLINEILKEYDFTLYIRQLKTKFDIIRQYLSQLDFEVFYSDANNYAFIKVPFHYNLETVLVELQSSNIVIQSISDYYVGEHFFKGFIISVTDVAVASLHLSLQTVIEHFSN